MAKAKSTTEVATTTKAKDPGSPEAVVAVLNKMSAPLRKVYDVMQDRLSKEAKNGILNRYEIGVLIRSVHNDERKYGTHAVPILAEALGISESELYLTAQVADVYSKESLVKFMEDCPRLTYSHLRALAGIDNAKKRNSLEMALVNKYLTIEELQKSIKQATGIRSNNSGPQLPKSPVAGLNQMAKFSEAILTRQEVFERSVFDGFEDLEETQITPKFVGQLEEFIEQQQGLNQFSLNNIRKSGVMLDKCRRILSARSDDDDYEPDGDSEEAPVGDMLNDVVSAELDEPEDEEEEEAPPFDVEDDEDEDEDEEGDDDDDVEEEDEEEEEAVSRPAKKAKTVTVVSRR